MSGKRETANIVFSALFTAVIAIISQLYIVTPMGIPITLQTFAVSLCGYFLGAKWGAASILVYIAAGGMGLPVFSGFQGGLQHILSPTGGFIIGFIFLVVFCGALSKSKTKYLRIFGGISGIIVCHIAGTLQFALVTGTPLAAAFVAASLPFLLKDIICVIIAFTVSVYMKKLISKYSKNA